MNTEKNISDIIETIQEKHIAPIPRWAIVAKDIAFWTLLVGIGIIGALFLSLALVGLLDIGPDVFRTLGIRHFPLFLFFSTPPLWTLLFALSVSFGILAFHNTKHGYRYRTLFVGSLMVLFILTIVLVGHIVQWDNRIDRAFEHGIPGALHGILPPRASRWSIPENGIIAGQILAVQDDSFTLQTPRDETWTILMTNRTHKEPTVDIKTGQSVLIIGTPRENKSFEASFIRPLRNGNDEQDRKESPMPESRMRRDEVRNQIPT